MRSVHQHTAAFWITEGVLWRNDLTVPSPPPPVIVIAVVPRLESIAAEPPQPTILDRLHELRFRLTHWSASGEVAHYDLAGGTRPGWRYLVTRRGIIPERIGVERSSAFGFAIVADPALAPGELHLVTKQQRIVVKGITTERPGDTP